MTEISDLELLLSEAAASNDPTVMCFEHAGRYFEVRVTPLNVVTVAEYMRQRHTTAEPARGRETG